MSRVFITGDIHGWLGADRFNANNFKEGVELSKDDYVIVLGDFGYIWNTQKSKAEERELDRLNDKPWTTLFIDGNHENFSRLEAYPVEEWNGGKIHRIRSSIIHLMRGQVFDINNKKWFTYGGAESTDRAYRTPFKSWWPQETPTTEEYQEGMRNLESNDFKVDYVLTHAMPRDYIEELFYSPRIGSSSTPNQLYDFKTVCEYKDWYCGHYHIDLDMKDNFHMLYKKIVEVT